MNSTRTVSRRTAAARLAALASLLLAGEAHAKVTLPGGKPIPDPALSCYGGKPGGLAAIFACACTQPGVCNIGAACPGGSTSCDPGTYGTCETTLWHKVNDDPCIPTYSKGLDAVQDASTQPETFQPACGRTFQLLTRGAAMFQNGFGWYNVVPGQKPSTSDLHVLVDCKTKAGANIAFDLAKDPNYKGGDVGFFLVTPESHTKAGSCASNDCCATVARALSGEGYIYYSEAKHNPDHDGSGQWIHLLTYTSQIFSHTFYFTWEDTYQGTSTDYADFVTQVQGITCAGAGQQCDTGKKGTCGLGVTSCDSLGKLGCLGANQAGKEECDGLDNDCDGTVDNGAVCPSPKVCHQGQCVPRCTTSSEFPCPFGYDCDKATGLCVGKQCKGVTCKPGEICLLGKCGTGCENVVCPKDQVCQAGACVNPCAGKVCKQGEVCKWGSCLPDCTKCGGVTCVKPLACDAKTGDCHDPSCTPACAAGTYCKTGKCVDTCDGVKCPGGVQCVSGTCPPAGSPGTGLRDGGVQDSFPPWGGDWRGAGEGGGGTAGATAGKSIYMSPDCTCGVGRGDGALLGVAPVALLLLLMVLARRRPGA